MKSDDFFQLTGVWILRDFLSRDQAEKIVDAVEGGTPTKSTLTGGEYSGLLDERIRRSHTVIAPLDLEQSVRKLLTEVKPVLERKFGLSLSIYEGPSFLRYGPGDFFSLHQDEPKDSRAPSPRQLSTTIFLNDGAHQAAEDTFQGGELLLHVSLPGKSQNKSVLNVKGVTGSLVAFRSTVPHEVRPVISGKRITIVGWYR